MAEAREAALPAALGPVGASDRAVTSERALVRAAQGGSAAAVEELFGRHWPRAHRAAWLDVHDAAAAEDVAQKAFLAAVRSLHRFDRRRPFGPWLHRIFLNRAIDHCAGAEGAARGAGRGGGGGEGGGRVVAVVGGRRPMRSSRRSPRSRRSSAP